MLSEELDLTTRPTCKKYLFKRELILFLDKNHQNSHLKISDIAKAVRLSERQLSRNIRQLFGITPTRYVRRFRLEKAKIYLFLGHQISDVAAQIGFSSVSYFSLNFKAEYGCCATEYFGRIKQEIENTFNCSKGR